MYLGWRCSDTGKSYTFGFFFLKAGSGYYKNIDPPNDLSGIVEKRLILFLKRTVKKDLHICFFDVIFCQRTINIFPLHLERPKLQKQSSSLAEIVVENPPAPDNDVSGGQPLLSLQF